MIYNTLDSLFQNRLFNLGEIMAKKQSTSSEGTKIRRIKATDNAPKQPTSKKATTKSTETTKEAKLTTKPKKGLKSLKILKAKKDSAISKKPPVNPTEEPATKNPFKAFARYVKGAWYELRQVRWPDRAATWSLTLAILVFTAFFVVLVILLDTGFNWLFEQILR